MLGLVFGQPFIKRFALCYRTVVCLSVCDIGVLWPNGWMDQDETWRGGRPLPRPHCVRWGPHSPSKMGAHHPQFLFFKFIFIFLTMWPGLRSISKWNLHPASRLATIDIGRKLGSAPFWGREARSSPNTMSLWLRPTSLQSGILINPAIWPVRFKK